MKRLSFKFFNVMVIGLVGRIIREQHKILKAVVGFIPINMVDYFSRFKVSSKIFFHNEMMFKDISTGKAKRMIRCKNTNISASNHFPTFPTRVINARKLRQLFSLIPRFTNSLSSFIPRRRITKNRSNPFLSFFKFNPVTFMRTKNSLSKLAFPTLKFFSTNFTNKCNFRHAVIISVIIYGCQGFFFVPKGFSAPTNSMNITPAAVASTTIAAADENSRNNEVSTKYNAHDHQDSTKTTSNTFTIGDNAVGNKTYAVSTDQANDPSLRFNTTTDIWEVSTDGTNQRGLLGVSGIIDLDRDTGIFIEKTADSDTIIGVISNAEVIDIDSARIQISGVNFRVFVTGVIALEVSGVGLRLVQGITVNEFSTDGVFARNSDTIVPTERAVRTFVESQLTRATLKAWIIFNGTGTVAILDSFNVSGLADNGNSGDYTITLDTDFASINYTISGGVRRDTADSNTSLFVVVKSVASNPLAGSVNILVTDNSNTGTDAEFITVTMAGDQ